MAKHALLGLDRKEINRVYSQDYASLYGNGDKILRSVDVSMISKGKADGILSEI
jgi:hypothetical protein